jgi:hypothetical protein
MENKTPWHRESWEYFTGTSLPELIDATCGISSYRIEPTGKTCSIVVRLNSQKDASEAVFSNIPVLDERGVFLIDGKQVLVVPIASDESLSDIQCVGEQLYNYLKKRIEPAPDGMLEDEDAVHSWMPLYEFIALFFNEIGQPLDAQNWFAISTHLRRIKIESVTDFVPEAQIGKICPFETPEGPNISKILTIAVGAEIKDGAVVRRDNGTDFDETGLGVTASMIPFIERSYPARLLMGCNMMRQWIKPLQPEPAIVTTGYEPEDEDIWCGHNLLTAFMSLGRSTFEDALVLSESTVARMQYEIPLEIGDKLSNRHGQKGVIGRILPDTEMPMLANGRTVDCVCSFIGLHTRMNTGQIWEAVYSRLVEIGAVGSQVQPFNSPDRDHIARLLSEHGLPKNGGEKLKLADGSTTTSAVTVGQVYWGRTKHISSQKLFVNGSEKARQLQGEMEYNALRNAGAYAVISEANSLTAEDSPLIEKAVTDILKGANPALVAYSSQYEKLKTKLRFAGITANSDETGLSFNFSDPGKTDLELPEPFVHPWIATRQLTTLPANTDSPLWTGLENSVERLRALLQSDAPGSLVDSSRARLKELIFEYFGSLIDRQDFVVRGRRLFSGRTVIVPACDLLPDQIGLPEEMAWVLFQPLVEAEVGQTEVTQRSKAAKDALYRIAGSRWIYINRAPTFSETAIIGFHPIVVSHKAIELHPLVYRWMNADFDGDQVAVYHPLTEEAQQDVEERLSIVGHLNRDPSLVGALVPTHESLWGLAFLSLSKKGQSRIKEILGGRPEMPERYLTDSVLASYFEHLINRIGAEKIPEMLNRLLDLGLDTVMRFGASLDPFMQLPKKLRDTPDLARNEIEEAFASSVEFEGEDFSTQLLTIKSGARGKIDHMVMMTASLSPRFSEPTQNGLLEGLIPRDMFNLSLDSKKAIVDLVCGMSDSAAQYNRSQRPTGYNVLARAVRTGDTSTGIVIASAAASREIDPLADLDARLFMGLPIAK